MSMFWLGFIAAFGVATVVVIWWIGWDERKQAAEDRAAMDEYNTTLLLDRVRSLESELWGGDSSVMRRVSSLEVQQEELEDFVAYRTRGKK